MEIKILNTYVRYSEDLPNIILVWKFSSLKDKKDNYYKTIVKSSGRRPIIFTNKVPSRYMTSSNFKDL
jgi:hypothetical protein